MHTRSGCSTHLWRLYLTILVSNSRTKGLVYVALESCKSLIMQRAQESGGGGGHPRCPVRSLAFQPLLFSLRCPSISIFQTPEEQSAHEPLRPPARTPTPPPPTHIIYNWIAPSADWQHIKFLFLSIDIAVRFGVCQIYCRFGLLFSPPGFNF